MATVSLKCSKQLLACLASWGEGFARELSLTDFSSEEGCVRLVEDFPLDIFTRMMGKTLDDFRSRLRWFDTDGIQIQFLAPADLIFLKENSWPEKDRLDVAALREIIARGK